LILSMMLEVMTKRFERKQGSAMEICKWVEYIYGQPFLCSKVRIRDIRNYDRVSWHHGRHCPATGGLPSDFWSDSE
jgi:hypothetical protein